MLYPRPCLLYITGSTGGENKSVSLQQHLHNMKITVITKQQRLAWRQQKLLQAHTCPLKSCWLYRHWKIKSETVCVHVCVVMNQTIIPLWNFTCVTCSPRLCSNFHCVSLWAQIKKNDLIFFYLEMFNFTPCLCENISQTSCLLHEGEDDYWCWCEE